MDPLALFQGLAVTLPLIVFVPDEEKLMIFVLFRPVPVAKELILP